MVRISDIRSRQILDSRGNPTIETDIITKKGIFRSSVPSGASTGVHEAREIRDHAIAYGGRGVLKAVKTVQSLKRVLTKNDWTQKSFDTFLITTDGTKNKSKLGANAMLSLSMAFSRAEAAQKSMALYEHIARTFKAFPRLPIPGFNMVNGGKHADGGLDIQEYMLFPTKAKTFREAIRIGSELYHELKVLLHQRYGKRSTNVGDEGGFVPPFKHWSYPFDYLLKAADSLGYEKKVRLGIDAAATSFYKKGFYTFQKRKMSKGRLLDVYERMIEEYPVVSIEDPFEEEDFSSFAELLAMVKGKAQIVGDDITVTNHERIETAILHGSCDALLLKVNQIGTVTEALDAAKLVKQYKWNTMVSHRSGETTDSFIADFAVGIGSGQLKSGAPCRGERLAKYNQLLRIEEALGKRARYGGTL